MGTRNCLLVGMVAQTVEKGSVSSGDSLAEVIVVRRYSGVGAIRMFA